MTPICGRCHGDMRVIDVHHKVGNTTRHPICPDCITSRPQAEEPEITTPRLTLIRTRRGA